MKIKPPEHIISFSLASVITALLSKDFLTPVLLLGRSFAGRSTTIKILILIVLITAYFFFYWKVLPILFSWLSKKWSEKFFFVFIFIATVGIMSSELFKPGIFPAYDIDYHMLRIESISESLRIWQIPVRINPVFLNGYGYASSLFYPDLFLYFPALLRLAGLSTILSAKVFFVLIFALCFLSAYWCVKQICSSSYAGLMAAVVYCLSQYLLQNVYRRGAVGEMQAFIFLPLIVFGLYSLINDRFESYWVMALGFICLFFSHLISLLIAALLSVFVSIFHLKTIFKDKVRVSRILKLILITLCCTISFWLPLIEQLLSGTFKFNQSTYLMRSSAVKVPTLFAVTGKFSGDYVAFGLPMLVLCLVWLFARKVKGNEQNKQIASWALGIGVILLFLVTDKFPWEWMSGPINIIQFPWRLYSFASIFFALAIGTMLDMILPNKDRYLAVVLLVAFMGIPATWVIAISSSKPRELPADFYLQPQNSFLINNGEWLPTQTSLENLQESSAKVLDQNGNPVPFSRQGFDFQIEPIDDCTYLDLPLLFYKGYSASFVDDLGYKSDLEIERAIQNHTVRVQCANNVSERTIRVAYNGTALQHISLAINYAFIASLALFRRFKPKWLN